MIQVGVLLLLCIAAVSAGAPDPLEPPPCISTLRAAANFDPKLLEGVWYEVRQNFAAPRRDGTCGAAKYTVGPDGTLEVVRGWLDNKKKKKKVTGTAKARKNAELSIRFEDSSSDKYTIFFIEKDTVFGTYACIKKKAYVSVYATKPEVDDNEIVKNVHAAMVTSRLDVQSLKFVRQRDCESAF